MISAYKRGLKRTSIYYCSGVLLCLGIQLATGETNFSLVPRSILVIVVMLLIALPWTILNFTNLGCPVKRPQNLGELVIHGLIFILAASWLLYVRSFF
jgi:hypothetical protein